MDFARLATEPARRLRRAARWVLAPVARRLDVRIVMLFLGLLLAIQATSFLAVRHTIDRSAERRLGAELRTGENVLRQLLKQNSDSLTKAAAVLASDYGFREAISSNDQATLVDALQNHGDRIHATVAIYTDASYGLVASTLAQPGPVLEMVRKSARATIAGEATDLIVEVLDGQPFQLVTVPVKAPRVIGYVAMGIPLRSEIPTELQDISGLRMALLSRRTGEPWHVLSIGDNATALRRLESQFAPDAVSLSVDEDGDQLVAHVVPLGRDGADEVAAILLRSFDEAVAPYRRMQWTMLAITLLGVVVFGAGSVITARRITGPIKALSLSAERLGAGDYSEPVSVDSRDEVQDLARAFERMRQGMQVREARIKRLAYWDELTGLPNREQFRNEVREHLRAARRDGAPCAIVLLDLDRFKHVNNVLGQAFGDRLLRQIARRLSDQPLRDGDLLARLGSDEFAVCLRQADADTATAVAQRLKAAFDVPVTLDDHTVDVSAAFGIATFPRDADEADALIVRAEMAMYAAKSRQTSIVVYDAGIDSSSQESLSLLGELRTAVDHDQLRLFLQPKVALADGRVLGAEALVRWQHPQRGMVAPMRFIPFAEQTGFIRVLTGWMIERCALRSRLMAAQGMPMKFAINLSTRDLLDQDLPTKLEKLLAREAMDPTLLCLEITESAIMDDPQRAMQTLNRLHGMGLKLSIDDFGTGYSSLAYLKRLPVHELKIDKSFVMQMEQQDRADLKIVRSTIDLAHNLGLSVVAEGVETPESWALLRALKCDEAQGYFMARPMPEQDFGDWLSGWRAPQTRLNTEFAEFV